MTEAGVTIIDFNSMQNAIQSYHQKVQTIQGIIQALQAVQRALSVGNVFTGGAASSTLAAIKAYIDVMNQALENLNKIIDFLQKKLDAYTNAHKQAESLANSIVQAQWAEV